MSKPECSGANECNLWMRVNNPFIPLTGSKNPQILFVGESPSESDDIQGSNFVDISGNFLREAIKSVGIDLSGVAFTQVVKCRVAKEGTRFNKAPSVRELNLCKVHALSEIYKLKPKIVVTLGATATKGILDMIGITKIRGRKFYIDDIVVIPTFSPLALTYDPTNENDFLNDLIAVKDTFMELVGSAKSKIPVKYQLIDSFHKLNKFINYALEFDEVSFDLETSSYNPFNENSYIVCASFSFKEAEAFVIPLTHSRQIFSGSTLIQAKKVIKVLLESNMKKIAHNGKFDIMWLKTIEGIEVNNFWMDTMLAQYLISEERGTHSLDYCSWQYTDMEDYYAELHQYVKSHKEANPDKGGGFANIPWDVLLPYSAGDADCTYRVSKKLREFKERF